MGDRVDLPQTLTGFLAPGWKGRLALEATDFDWMHGVVAVMGEERGLDFFDAHQYFMLDPIKSIDEGQHWEKLWNELFLK